MLRNTLGISDYYNKHENVDLWMENGVSPKYNYSEVIDGEEDEITDLNEKNNMDESIFCGNPSKFTDVVLQELNINCDIIQQVKGM